MKIYVGDNMIKGPQMKIYDGDNLKGPKMKIYDSDTLKCP